MKSTLILPPATKLTQYWPVLHHKERNIICVRLRTLLASPDMMATIPKEMKTANGSHTVDTNTISKEYLWKNLGSHLMPWTHWWRANRRSVDTANADKGNVTRDDSQRRLLAQHSVAMLEQCCNHSKQCCNNVSFNMLYAQSCTNSGC